MPLHIYLLYARESPDLSEKCNSGLSEVTQVFTVRIFGGAPEPGDPHCNGRQAKAAG